MIWTVGAKVYTGTSVLWSACEAEIGSQMVVVVEETLMVEVERCSEKAGGLVVYTKATALMANEAVYGSCHRFPMWRPQTVWLDEEGNGIEVRALDHGGEADVWEFATEIDQAVMQECPG